MKNFISRKSITNYIGVATIIPCEDLPKMKDQFDETREDITEAFMDNIFIGDCKVNKVIRRRYYNEDFDDCDDELWQNIVCRKLNKGFVVIYKVSTPKKIFKNKSGEVTRFSQYENLFQTNYVYLKNLSDLSAILTNIDNEILEKEWEKQEAGKQEK